MGEKEELVKVSDSHEAAVREKNRRSRRERSPGHGGGASECKVASLQLCVCLNVGPVARTRKCGMSCCPFEEQKQE